jgi:hypothetical protein
VLTACASSGAPSSPSAPQPSATGAAVDEVQRYVDAVNALCDDLLPKIVAVTNGGSFDIPLKDFFAQLPAHTKLRTDFDAALARITVPAAARSQQAALAAYVRFANHLDARRLAAARQGAKAYADEIAAESDAANDPTISAMEAAGFNESCTAR